jgi:hypothetical protein
MTGLREKTIHVLKNLEMYYLNLGDEYETRVENIQEQLKNLPFSEDLDLFLTIVEKCRKELKTLDEIPSIRKNERIKLVLDRLISILRIKHLLKLLGNYTYEKKEYYDLQTMQKATATDEDEDEDDPVTTLEEYAQDDDVYVS